MRFVLYSFFLIIENRKVISDDHFERAKCPTLEDQAETATSADSGE